MYYYINDQTGLLFESTARPIKLDNLRELTQEEYFELILAQDNQYQGEF